MPNYLKRPMRPDTDFFRDRNLVYFTDKILPTARHLGRISWAEVGCSSGRETWPIAAIMQHHGLSYEIEAIDKSEIDLQLARNGRYDRARDNLLKNARLNKAPQGCLRFFSGLGNDEPDSVAPVDALRQHVTFTHQDLLVKSLSRNRYNVVSAFNFLHYYVPVGQNILMGNMLSGLRQGGYFLCEDHGKYADWADVTRDFGLEPVRNTAKWPLSIFQKVSG